MRIVIVDLHCNGFILCTFEKIINRYRSVAKHAFFLDEAIENGYEVVDYVTGTRSYLWIGKELPLLNRWEAIYVIKKNGLKGKVSIITDVNKIREDDLVIFYPHLNASFNLCAVPGHKYANVNHFFNMTSTDRGIAWSDFLESKGFEGYICEADVLNDSPLFREIFPVNGKKMLLLPYVAKQRFERKTEYCKRNNKAVALGSFSQSHKYQLYKEIYGTEWLHPMRWEILQNKDRCQKQIECMIEELKFPEPYFEIGKNENGGIKFLKRVINHFFMAYNSPFRMNGKQGEYYSKDRVALLNDYKMFIYPEEITGVPALGFVEGMSCGCAYIGLDSPMYTKLGMKPGEHYIGYDGTYDDLLEKIRYYQEHGDELERIAENGYRFVQENLNAKTVFKRFIEQFERQKDKGANGT